MPEKTKQISLREPGFLLWLGQFIGEWRLEGEVEVGRRDDGFLEIFFVDTRQSVIHSAVVVSQLLPQHAVENTLNPTHCCVIDLPVHKQFSQLLKNAFI
jgi:hypothetical protein